MKNFIGFLALMPLWLCAQTDLIGVVYSGTTITMAKINVNTGFTTPFGNIQPNLTSIYGGVNSAFNCTENEFVFGKRSNNQYSLLVVDKSNGSVKNTFGHPLQGLSYNSSGNKYYGIDGYFDFVSIDASSGIKTTVSTNTLATRLMLDEVGSTIDATNNRYITVAKLTNQQAYNIVSISCQTGIYTVATQSTYLCPLSIVYNNALNKCYCIMPDISGYTFGELNIATGSVTAISQFTANMAMSGGTDARGGASINEQAGVYSFVGVGNKIVSIDLSSGTILSNPTVSSGDAFFIQYANCFMPSGIEENTLNTHHQGSTYYNLYGQLIDPIPGVLMVEKRGNSVRKIIIEN